MFERGPRSEGYSNNMAREIMGFEGRMISSSKSAYYRANPGNIIIFNACLVKDGACFWCGDLDVTKDNGLLKQLQQSIGEFEVHRESWWWDFKTIEAVALF